MASKKDSSILTEYGLRAFKIGNDFVDNMNKIGQVLTETEKEQLELSKKNINNSEKYEKKYQYNERKKASLLQQQQKQTERFSEGLESTRKSIVSHLMSNRNASEVYQSKINLILNKKHDETYKLSKQVWEDQEQTRDAVRNLITPVFGELVNAFDTTISVLQNLKSVATGVGKMVTFVRNFRTLTDLSSKAKEALSLEQRESWNKTEREQYLELSRYFARSEINEGKTLTLTNEISKSTRDTSDIGKKILNTFISSEPMLSEREKKGKIKTPDITNIIKGDDKTDPLISTATKGVIEKSKSSIFKVVGGLIKDLLGSNLLKIIGPILGVVGLSKLPTILKKIPGLKDIAKGAIGTAGKYGGRFLTRTAPIGIAGGLVEMGGKKLEESGHTNLGKGLQVVGTTTQGAALGAMFGPIGAAIGGVVGLGYGLWKVTRNVNDTVEQADEETQKAQASIKSIHKQGMALDEIAKAEGTYGKGDYNAIVGYDKFLTPEMKNRLDEIGGVSNMSLSELRQFRSELLKQSGSLNSSAVGRYQIVGKTLFGTSGYGGLYKELGLTDDTIFTPELQDKMASRLMARRLAQSQGDIDRYYALMGKEWQGLEKRGISNTLDNIMRQQIVEYNSMRESTRLSLKKDSDNEQEQITQAVRKGVELAFKDGIINVNVSNQNQQQMPAMNYFNIDAFNQATG